MVTELSPVCRRIGSFVVASRAGVNHVRFRGRVGKRLLAPGVYRLDAQRGTSVLFGVRIVVARNRVIRPAGIARTSFADPCATSTAGTPSELSALASFALAPGAAAGPGSTKFTLAAAEPAHPGQALGTEFTQTAARGTGLARTVVLVALALAMALLAAASVPSARIVSPRLDLLLVRHRLEIALAGVSMLVLAVFIYLAWVS